MAGGTSSAAGESSSANTYILMLPELSEQQVMAAAALVFGAVLWLGITGSRVEYEDACPYPAEETLEEEDRKARQRYSKTRMEKATPGDGWDVIVIGSGPSGLTCAASLARLGRRCCVLDQGEELGGGAHVFALRGYEFETGVHYLGVDKEMENMLDFATYGRLELAPIGSSTAEGGVVHDEIFIGERPSFAFTAGASSFRAMLRERFPEDGVAIDKFVDKVEAFRSAKSKQDAAWFFRLKAASFLTPWLCGVLQRTLARRFWGLSQITAEDAVRDCGVDPTGLLGSVLLGQYSDAGVRPDKLSALLFLGIVAHYLEGARYPVGGSGAMPRKMAAVVRAAGGATFMQANVSALHVSGGQCMGVIVNGETVVTAPVVVSSIGALQTYELLTPHLDVSREIASLRQGDEPSVAFVFLFCALDISAQPADERDHTSHNRWLYPGTNFTKAEKDFESGKPWSKPGIMFVASGSAKDASWEVRFGANKKTVVVLSQCPWAWVAPWAHLSHEERRHSESYEAFKTLTQETLMEQGFRRVFPELEKYILFTEVGTPLTTNTFLGKKHGECYGRSAIPKHWGCPELTPYTPLEGFYQTGQDTGEYYGSIIDCQCAFL
eukprot:COSAG02_NODE_86_length_39084_cov_17.815724_1_plen_609_part_00